MLTEYSELPGRKLGNMRCISRPLSRAGSVRFFGVLLVLVLLTSCSSDESSDLPAFESFGFQDSLDVVRERVLGGYEFLLEKPMDAGRNGRFGMHLSAYDKNASAEIFFRRANVFAPEDYRWSYYLADSLRQQGRLDEAAVAYREVLKIKPGHVNSRLQLAGILLEVGDAQGGRTLYQEFTVEFPDRVEGWLGLGKANSVLGDHDAAVDALRRALRVDSRYGEIHYALAQALRARGDKGAAAEELAIYERNRHYKIRTEDPLLEEVETLYAGDANHYSLAVHFYKQGDYKNAVKSYRAAVGVNPANVYAWSGLVAAHVSLKNLEAAGDTYRMALAEGIAYARLHLIYGHALLEAGQVAAARDVFNQALQLDPQFTDTLSAMGKLEMQNGNSAAAADYYRRLLLVRPGNRRGELLLARALNAAGEFEEAAGLLEQIIKEADADNSPSLTELAIAYHGLGRKDEALEVLQQGRAAAGKALNAGTLERIDRLLAEWQGSPAE